MAEFTVDHQAWFRLWLPLGARVPTDDTYRLLVSAFLVREGLTLVQEPCEAKSHELTAILRLLARVVLEGTVVTIDDAGCQRAIVQDLQAAGADYVLAVKRNQPTLHAEVRAAFEEAERGAFTPEVQHH